MSAVRQLSLQADRQWKSVFVPWIETVTSLCLNHTSENQAWETAWFVSKLGGRFSRSRCINILFVCVFCCCLFWHSGNNSYWVPEPVHLTEVALLSERLDQKHYTSGTANSLEPKRSGRASRLQPNRQAKLPVCAVQWPEIEGFIHLHRHSIYNFIL